MGGAADEERAMKLYFMMKNKTCEPESMATATDDVYRQHKKATFSQRGREQCAGLNGAATTKMKRKFLEIVVVVVTKIN